MINCNPETVSTDYDTSDRLYFEPLTSEHVLDILKKEQEKGSLKGVIVQFGGQTPLKLAGGLEKAGIPILGTSPDAIDLAEDRDRFKALVDENRAATRYVNRFGDVAIEAGLVMDDFHGPATQYIGRANDHREAYLSRYGGRFLA